MSKSILFLVFPIFFFACFEPREGCLDIEATNFDAAADKDCCCNYPKLNITLLPRFDTLVWKPDTAYQYAPGKWFRLKQAVFYLSGFELVQGGVTNNISDTLSLKTWNATNDTVPLTFTNDFQLIRRTATNYSPGTFRPSGSFETFRFWLGLPDPAQRIIPALTPDGHPLRSQPEGLWMGRDTGFVALKLVFTRDTFSSTVPDTLHFYRPDFMPFLFEQDGPFFHESGYDFKLDLTVDYREFFRDVDLSTGDISAWKARISANLPNVFRVSQ